MLTFDKISYSLLNSRQQETFNFQKVSAVLADYGFATIKLNDDWQGADFIAQHIDGIRYLKVQLKGRLTFDKKYLGKEIFICFHYQGHWYLYPHDEVLTLFLNTYSSTMAVSKSWLEGGLYTYPKISIQQIELLSKYRL
ncbi:MAG: hypothetical protein JWP58_132 [Hymenobacter sp.]|nr:hypothetical protein [Hymenobacter sp.]